MTRRVVLCLVVCGWWAATTNRARACIDFLGCDEVVREHVRAEVAGWCSDPSVRAVVECAATQTELRLFEGDAVSEARVETDALTPETAARVVALVLSELRREVHRESATDEVADADPSNPTPESVSSAPSVSTSLGAAELQESDSAAQSSSATPEAPALSPPSSTAARGALWPRPAAATRRWLVGGVLSRPLAASWLAGFEASVEVGPLSVFGTFVTGTRTVAQGELRASAVRGGLGAAVVSLRRGTLFGFVEPRVSLGWMGVRGSSNEAWRGVASGTWTWEAGLGVGLGLGLRRLAVQLLGEIGWSRGLRATDSTGEVVADLHGWVARLGLHVAYGGGG